MTAKNYSSDDLGRITSKLSHGGEGGNAGILRLEGDAPAAMPARPIGPLDASDREHLTAIDALLLAEHKIGAMTIRRARDFLAHEERIAAKGGGARRTMAPAERLIAARVIALSMKRGFGRDQAAAVFGDIAERARPGSGAA